ncbi:inactive pancreatic lipase-related protein 1-like [Ostrea edulis]|uniref:inactive pancreatic lipase-related protein 1-like n=1 Tax=Ostrea edulis TaxID=37623 RepID=UPI0024AFF194|nr:inactive pancreatic lipase-related protein 1-like [Ostrea edulis]XP_056013688.1 inactive pancreatic lipase-related protein 1-like [Ostrea edulis]XP_056013696.1 inactive pancreatic lipase-related protein 1-like [Ostrea edulis]XP_056013701.1 inactive pancreatic lipase-related protein 1-like [Ostrea edulis]
MMLKSLLFLLLLSSTQGWWIFKPKTKKVCFKNIGCFSNAKPFNNAKGTLPDSPDKIQTTFRLYTRQNKGTAQILKPYDSSSITNSKFEVSRPTIFITHGFTDTAKSGWPLQMKDALLQKADMNVITVDWSRGTTGFSYDKSTANTRVVGATVGNMVKALKDTVNLPLNRVHLIGHSLGAHVMGYAGDWTRGIGRITGLDPAGLNYERYDTKVKLDPSDANFVDVIHTDAASLLEMAFGIRTLNGHVDFFPNGGSKQPGCQRSLWTNIQNFLKGKFGRITDSVACSHMRAIYYFIESINSPCEFQAFPCNTYWDFYQGKCATCNEGCNRMGYHADESATGKFYLQTNAASPFCKND